uniref:Uncharacterized protein n=1 Tax=Ciona intestinalis TaxID=7719 RepID=H2XQW8_CIOIN
MSQLLDQLVLTSVAISVVTGVLLLVETVELQLVETVVSVLVLVLPWISHLLDQLVLTSVPTSVVTAVVPAVVPEAVLVGTTKDSKLPLPTNWTIILKTSFSKYPIDFSNGYKKQFQPK